MSTLKIPSIHKVNNFEENGFKLYNEPIVDFFSNWAKIEKTWLAMPLTTEANIHHDTRDCCTVCIESRSIFTMSFHIPQPFVLTTSIQQKYWIQIISLLSEFNSTIIELKDSKIMLGYTNGSPHWTFLDHILAIGKQITYSSRLRTSNPLSSQFIIKLKCIECIQHYITERKEGIHFHEEKCRSYTLSAL